MENRKRVAVVVGSNRPARICPGIAEWIRAELQRSLSAELTGAVSYELLDLAAVDLPFLDEPLIPAFGQYRHEHTKAWSRTVSGFDGFIFVFPQYNWGYPAVLKNALDYLFTEWAGKPVSYATYGTHGGGRAARQIRGVLAGLRMRELHDHLEIVITVKDVDSEWQIKDLDAVLGRCRPRLKVIGGQMLDALEVPGGHGGRAGRSKRAVVVTLRRARLLVRSG